jgi:hypothetical protein
MPGVVPGALALRRDGLAEEVLQLVAPGDVHDRTREAISGGIRRVDSRNEQPPERDGCRDSLVRSAPFRCLHAGNGFCRPALRVNRLTLQR